MPKGDKRSSSEVAGRDAKFSRRVSSPESITVGRPGVGGLHRFFCVGVDIGGDIERASVRLGVDSAARELP